MLFHTPRHASPCARLPVEASNSIDTARTQLIYLYSITIMKSHSVYGGACNFETISKVSAYFL